MVMTLASTFHIGLVGLSGWQSGIWLVSGVDVFPRGAGLIFGDNWQVPQARDTGGDDAA
jgi:hypothetical protein